VLAQLRGPQWQECRNSPWAYSLLASHVGRHLLLQDSPWRACGARLDHTAAGLGVHNGAGQCRGHDTSALQVTATLAG
jgi:hypothetical protein